MTPHNLHEDDYENLPEQPAWMRRPFGRTLLNMGLTITGIIAGVLVSRWLW